MTMMLADPPRRALLLGAAAFAVTLTAAPSALHAREVALPGGSSMWLPDDWTAKTTPETILAQAPEDGINLRAQVLPLTGKLAQVDLDTMLDDELDDYKVDKDELRAFNGALYRRVQGTGKDGQDDIVFDLRLAPQATADKALALLFYGVLADMREKEGVDAIAAIFKKAMAGAPRS